MYTTMIAIKKIQAYGGDTFIQLRPHQSLAILANTGNSFFMLWTIAVILFVLWLLGLVTSNTLGGFIHILVVLAIIVVLIRVIRGEKVL